MAYKINEIEGIGPANAEKLMKGGIKTTDDLLKMCCDPAGRTKTAEKTGIADKTLLKWANMADLMRIKGIGGEFAELLEATGVNTVKELGTRNAANLAAAAKQINEAKSLTRALPSADVIAKWITEAKTLPPMIKY